MLEHEKRLDNTVPAGQFGDGEGVEIKTRMGSTVTRGHVLSVTPFGLVIRETSGETKFYKDGLYLFASLEREPPTVVKDQLHDMSVDQKVKHKLAAMGEAGDPVPDQTGAKPMDPDANDDDYKGKDTEKDKDDNEPGKKKDDEKDGKKKDAVADPDSSIEVEKLPDDIKQGIISANDMDEAQLNGVLSEISDAALKALKRTGIAETQIFGLVQKINDVTFKVLTGKAPGKKKG